MAKPISKREITRLHKANYEDIRSSLKTGDLVFCSGNYYFSKVIQYFTKSVWSHVGVIYKDEQLGRVLILESEVGIGVRLAPVSKYLKDYHGRNKPYKGNIVVANINPPVDVKQVNNAISFGLDELTKPYDNFEILRIMVRILFRITRRTRDRKYICSELIDACYHKAGLKFSIFDNYISPYDIWRDSKVEMVARIL